MGSQQHRGSKQENVSLSCSPAPIGSFFWMLMLVMIVHSPNDQKCLLRNILSQGGECSFAIDPYRNLDCSAVRLANTGKDRLELCSTYLKSNTGAKRLQPPACISCNKQVNLMNWFSRVEYDSPSHKHTWITAQQHSLLQKAFYNYCLFWFWCFLVRFLATFRFGVDRIVRHTRIIKTTDRCPGAAVGKISCEPTRGLVVWIPVRTDDAQCPRTRYW